MQKYCLLVCLAWCGILPIRAQTASMSLNGCWELGTGRRYDRTAMVPGVVADPTRVQDDSLWYRREVVLPKGSWRAATLELCGARFRPSVFVDGEKVSFAEGGMAPTSHLLAGRDVKPGRRITLEVALASLAAVPQEDASCIPTADRWRTNNSSGLWDDVNLHFHYAALLRKVVLVPDVARKNLRVDWTVEALPGVKLNEGKGMLTIWDRSGRKCIEQAFDYRAGRNSVQLDYDGLLEEWSPEHPNLYTMELRLDTRDARPLPFGIKEFRTEGKEFRLNGRPCPLRGSTVVWHRWVRTPEGARFGYDTTWFRDNVVLRLKEHGANFLRFHLGTPPRRLLDLCDRYGLAVQYEWSFFHGMPASESSCTEQYGRWLEASVAHPSVCIYHPYNETEGDELGRVWRALNTHLPDYPPLVLSERDVLHLHKYWWSIFENVGVFYDSYEQFDFPIMVDEFGGNYLDGDGNPGGYVTLHESFLRFLGRDHTPEMRLKLQEYSHGRIAEYWRRIGAAGAAPFPIASSWEDGNHWFLGPLAAGRPKPVWNSLTAAWSPRSVSAEIWDRNFEPGDSLIFPLWFFNDTDSVADLTARVTVEDAYGRIYAEGNVSRTLSPYARESLLHALRLPVRVGDYVLRAELIQGRPSQVKYPVVSKWDIRIFSPEVPAEIAQCGIYVPESERELIAFVRDNGLHLEADPDRADLLLFGRRSWERMTVGSREPGEILRQALMRGASAVWVDVGDLALGQGYPRKVGDERLWGPLQGVAKIEHPGTSSYELFPGLKLLFTEVAEPESFQFPAPGNEALWRGMPAGYSGLWNGYRGGLTVPACDLSVAGLTARSFLEQWTARGADPARITAGMTYYGYELQGFYAFSDRASDSAVEEALRERVRFLIEDAPALAVVMDAGAPIAVTDLSAGYKAAQSGLVERLDILANAGKNLTRTPALSIGFGPACGRLVVSQFLTAGRLSAGFGTPGLYGVRYDPTAVQTVLNMLAEAIRPANREKHSQQ